MEHITAIVKSVFEISVSALILFAVFKVLQIVSKKFVRADDDDDDIDWEDPDNLGIV